MTTTPYNAKEALRVRRGELRLANAEASHASQRLAETIREARASGMTLQAIGDVLGLTRQRVKQMLDAAPH